MFEHLTKLNKIWLKELYLRIFKVDD